MPEEQTILFEKPVLVKVGKPFYNASLPNAMEQAQEYAGKNGHLASMPELACARTIADADEFAIKNWFTCASEEDKGRTEQGKGVYVVVHGKGILMNPARIRKAYDDGLINGAAKYSKKEFQNLLEGKFSCGSEIPVFSYSDFAKQKELPLAYAVVLDFGEVAKLKSGVQKIDSLRDNKLVIARLGGENPTNAYLDKSKQVFGSNIENWHDCANVDLDNPNGRLLFIRSNYFGLFGNNYLGSSGRFVGLRDVAQKISTGNAKQIEQPTLEQMIEFSKSFVPERLQEEFKKGLSNLYK